MNAPQEKYELYIFKIYKVQKYYNIEFQNK